MIVATYVGVKLPESGTSGIGVGVIRLVGVGVGVSVGVDVGDGVVVSVETGVGELVGVGVFVGVEVGVGVDAEGVDSNVGPSAACTTKVLVRVLKIPLESLHEIVIL